MSQNPCKDVHRPDASRPRDRVLTDAEIVKFWHATDAERKELSALFKLLLLTGCRLNEVAGMTRGELSENGDTWNIPGARTKNKRPHVVPLAPLARDILATVAGVGELVFTTTGRSPISGWSKIKARLDAAMKISVVATARFKAHGSNRHGRDRDRAPYCRGDTEPHLGREGRRRRHYNRAAYAAEKKTALERWAAHVQGVSAGKPATVVSLSRKRTK